MISDRGDRREEKRLLREFFAEAHADDRPPSFDRLARPRPAARRGSARSAWRPALAALGVVLAAVAVAWTVPRLVAPGADELSEEEQLALAQELSSWRGPLDFLLETPGREVLFAPPSFELTALTIPPPVDPEETKP